MQNITAKKVAKYALLPGIMPRAKALFASGFGYIAFLMAQIYNSVRLLPAGHPYLNPQNIGRFGIRHVIAEAANNLVIRKQNIDQLVIFILLLAAIVILFLQFALLLYTLLVAPANAQVISLFNTPDPQVAGPLTDIAFLMLDNVFGVPDLFCNSSGICTDVLAGGRLPFHIALHELFRFYSIGMLLIAMIIFLYFILVVVLETATTGTPFGQRFQNIWVPIRLVVALGLLVPINYGLNSGQYITLFSAKMGSGFATTAWHTFNDTLNTQLGANANPTGEPEAIIAKPNTPDFSPVVSFMSLAHSCAYGYWREDQTTPPDVTHPSRPGVGSDAEIRPYFVKNSLPWMANTNPWEEVTLNTSYADGLDFYNNGDIIIRFGRRAENTTANDEEEFKRYTGEVEPTCGEIRIHVTDLSNVGDGANSGGADQMQSFYFDQIKNMWFTDNDLIDMSHRYTEMALGLKPSLQCTIGCSSSYNLPVCTGSPAPCETERPGDEHTQTAINFYKGNLISAINDAWIKYNTNSTQMQMEPEILDRGWGGAGIWYNKIAELNGAFIGAVMNVPSISQYPQVMEKVLSAKRAQNMKLSGLDMFMPNQADGKTVKGLLEYELRIARALSNVFGFWFNDGADKANQDKAVGGNIFKNIMNLIFGTNGLFDIREQNQYIHPLAQLTAVGKGLVDSTVRNVAISTGFAALGGGLSATESFKGLGALSQMSSSFLTSTALVGLTAGFVLFYILPFLPFVYFYFAVGTWVKGIFEAMVAMPLWALAHLRIDGEGLPGDSASNGYFLIFDIFLRPILTVFGLVASMVIFTAQIRILNFIWGIVVDNVTGAEMDTTTGPGSVIFNISVERGIIDQFFYTVIYTIIVYMLATASFKLIDMIPDNLLRWMGSSAAAYSDINKEDDALGGLTRYGALGGLTVGRDAVGGIQKFASDTGGTLGGIVRGFSSGTGGVPKP